MEDKILIVIIASGATIVGALIAAIFSHFISRRSEVLKIRLSAAEFLRHKIDALEKGKEGLFEMGPRKEITFEMAVESMKTASSALLRAGHYLLVKAAA